jgi:hypothetical protein
VSSRGKALRRRSRPSTFGRRIVRRVAPLSSCPSAPTISLRSSFSSPPRSARRSSRRYVERSIPSPKTLSLGPSFVRRTRWNAASTSDAISTTHRRSRASRHSHRMRRGGGGRGGGAGRSAGGPGDAPGPGGGCRRAWTASSRRAAGLRSPSGKGPSGTGESDVLPGVSVWRSARRGRGKPSMRRAWTCPGVAAHDGAGDGGDDRGAAAGERSCADHAGGGVGRGRSEPWMRGRGAEVPRPLRRFGNYLTLCTPTA